MYKSDYKLIEESFSIKRVFLCYYSSLCFFANKLVQDYAAAEDIVEDVFLKLWTKNPDFSGYKNVKAVLYIAVKNACLDYIRKHRRLQQNNSSLKYLLQQESESFIQVKIIHTEIIAELYNLIQQLPEKRRYIMQLLFVEGWSSQQVAAYLGITVSVVNKQKAKGLLYIKNKIGNPFIQILFCI